MEHNGPQRTWTKQSTWTIVYIVFLLFSVRYEGCSAHHVGLQWTGVSASEMLPRCKNL